MVGAVVRSCCLMVLKDAPSASIRINRARNTYPAGRERDCAMLLSSARCSSLSNTSLVGMAILMPAQLVTFTQRQFTRDLRLSTWRRTLARPNILNRRHGLLNPPYPDACFPWGTGGIIQSGTVCIFWERTSPGPFNGYFGPVVGGLGASFDQNDVSSTGCQATRRCAARCACARRSPP